MPCPEKEDSNSGRVAPQFAHLLHGDRAGPCPWGQAGSELLVDG